MSARYTSHQLQRLEERFVIDGKEVTRARATRRPPYPPGRPKRSSRQARWRRSRPSRVHDGDRVRLFPRGARWTWPSSKSVRGPSRFHEHRLPIAAAIVSIDFDHEEQLGHTLASIAAEKAGVHQSGDASGLRALPAEALAVIAAVCAERGATLIRTDKDCRARRQGRGAAGFTAGRHQKANAAVALGLLTRSIAMSRVGCRSVPRRCARADQRPVGRGRVRALQQRLRGFDSGFFGFDSALFGFDSALFAESLTAGAESLTAGAGSLTAGGPARRGAQPAGARALEYYLREAAPDGVTLVSARCATRRWKKMLTRCRRPCDSLVCVTAPSRGP